ncbi:hypothetical protein [Fluviispira sanaruensis]|uniref:Uncharacterized protein n=1 Tax=Fluviispira sanaruensis TaxID=2493639 RepID=A0A4P2VMN1_FLUSA|nr:hypothetical protein [Fluviispira sanaruensis]BBH54663.1 hypothetical protein JCM31447_31370 [Fluviispira sanaruensis]
MSNCWAFSLVINEIPDSRFEEIKEGVKNFMWRFKIEDKFLFADLESAAIEILDCCLSGRYDFREEAIECLKQELWKNGFIEFYFGAEVVIDIITVKIGEDDFLGFVNNKNIEDADDESEIAKYQGMTQEEYRELYS